MLNQTIFLHNVTNVEITKQPFYSTEGPETFQYEQIKIIVRCYDGKSQLENELFLFSNMENTVSIQCKD